MYTVKLKDRTIGSGAPTMIVAELGINHNGDMELARKSIEAAAQAGADAIKFQNYKTEDFLSDDSLTYEYISQGKRVVESQYAMFKRCELQDDQLVQLKQWCEDAGILFFSTPTNIHGVQTLKNLDVPLLKNGSDYLSHAPLVRAMGRSSIPTILSTGMATLEDISDAVEAFRSGGGEDLIITLCTSSYPTPAEDVHLRQMDTLSQLFQCPVGLSDHSEGIVACLAAVARGACMLEKHFTLDRDLPGPDHRFSMNPQELKDLVEQVRFVEKCLGSPAIEPAQTEKANRTAFRLSCVLATEKRAGDILQEEDIIFQRPGDGWAPKFARHFIGRKARTSLPAFTQLDWSHLE